MKIAIGIVCLAIFYFGIVYQVGMAENWSDKKCCWMGFLWFVFLGIGMWGLS